MHGHDWLAQTAEARQAALVRANIHLDPTERGTCKNEGDDLAKSHERSRNYDGKVYFSRSQCEWNEVEGEVEEKMRGSRRG